MRRILMLSFCIMFLCQAMGAPSDRFSDEEGDSVEQELIRNHHSTAAERRLKSKSRQYSSELDDSSPIESIEDVIESEDEDDRSITEDDIYDITVGDVIRDVLLTLRDHPEIVKQLIASEKAKLSEQIDAFNNLVDGDSAGDSLAGFMKPAEQLKMLPKSVEKKTGRSGMPIIPGKEQVTEKRADEVINDQYTRNADTSESDEYTDFLLHPEEGGKDDPMFNNENSKGEESEESSVSQVRHDSSESDSNLDDSTAQFSYRFPFLNQRNIFKGKSHISDDENSLEVTKDHVTRTNEVSEELNEGNHISNNDEQSTVQEKRHEKNKDRDNENMKM